MLTATTAAAAITAAAAAAVASTAVVAVAASTAVVAAAATAAVAITAATAAVAITAATAVVAVAGAAPAMVAAAMGLSWLDCCWLSTDGGWRIWRTQCSCCSSSGRPPSYSYRKIFEKKIRCFDADPDPKPNPSFTHFGNQKFVHR